MSKKLYIVVILICGWSQIASASSIGFNQVQIFDEVFYRPLDAAIWYPAQKTEQPLEQIGRTAIFTGVRAIRHAPLLRGKYPVILLSHDYRENWQSLNWLARFLVQQGYLVAAVNHPGTTVMNHPADVASQWWERPEDLSRILTWLEDISEYSRHIDTEHVAAIGHGLGGWTVMQLAGAQFSSVHFEDNCKRNLKQKECSFRRELGFGIDAPRSLLDSRIKAVISLDIRLARGFTLNSLKNIHIPVLILGAGLVRNMTNQSEESGYVANYLPSHYAQYSVISQAQHFSFLEQCNTTRHQILKRFYAGNWACQEFGNFSRSHIHQIVFKQISEFLKYKLY